MYRKEIQETFDKQRQTPHVLTNEKDRLENELQSREVVIKEKNRMISDLEQIKPVFFFLII